jgi:hypothetical protein
MRDLGFDHVELGLPDGSRYEAWLHDKAENPPPEDCWTTRIPLPSPAGEALFQVSRHIERGEGYLMLHAVVETVREVLPSKIPAPTEPMIPFQNSLRSFGRLVLKQPLSLSAK